MNGAPKLRECYVDMEFLNPGPWLYNFTIDVMRDLGKEIKPRSIIRIMNGFLNLEKPQIPISYIPKYQIYRVIPGRKKLRKYTNLEEVCIEEYKDIHDSALLERKIRSNAKLIAKKLADDEFRKSFLFDNIMINARGLYEDVERYVIKMDEFLKLRRMAELENIQENINSFSVNPSNQLDEIGQNAICCINKDGISNRAEKLVIEANSQSNHATPGNKDEVSIQILNSSVEINYSGSTNLVDGKRGTSSNQESIKNSKQNINEFLFQVCTNCKTYEEFVQSTNFKELAAKRLNHINNKHVKKKLMEIISQNTWKQIQEIGHCKTYDNLDQIFCENLNNHTILTTARYTNMDKNILAFTYLKGLQTIFPHLYTFVKYTNAVRLIKENHRLNVEGVTKCTQEWYDDLLKNRLTQNKKYSRLKINAKYLFLIQYEQSLITFNNEMVQNEVLRQFNKESQFSYIQAAFPEGIASSSSDVPDKQLISQNILANEFSIKMHSNESVQKSPNILMDPKKIENLSNRNKEMYRELNTSGIISVIKENELHHNADIIDQAATIPLKLSHVSVIDTNIGTTLINSSSDELIEAIPTVSKVIPLQLNTLPNKISLIPDDIEELLIQKPLQDHRNGTIEYTTPNKLTRRHIEKNKESLIEENNHDTCQQGILTSTQIQVLLKSTNSCMKDTIQNSSQTQLPMLRTETIAKIPSSENANKQSREKAERVFNIIIQEIKKVNSTILPTLTIKETIMEKLQSVLSHTQKKTEAMPKPNSDNIDLDETQINPELEFIVKSEPQLQYSSYSDEVEVITNEPEIIQIEDSMTVSQLLASDDDELQHNTKQTGNEYYDLLRELNLNNSVGKDDELILRIDAVLDESNKVSKESDDFTTSQHLELSYNDLIQQPNIIERKRGRRKRKADAENQQNEIIDGRKIKPVDMRSCSNTTIQNEHITTASQLLNTQMSLFLESQLSIPKQTQRKQLHTVLPPKIKGNIVKNRKVANCQESKYERLAKHTKLNLIKHGKVVDYNIIIKSLHNFKLINIKFFKNFYLKNRNKYIFSQNTNCNVDQLTATLYAKYDRFTIRNQYLYKLLNLNKKQTKALKALLKIYEAYEFKFIKNYNNCDVSLLILYLYFRTIPSISQNTLILNVHSKDVEHLYDPAEYLNYKYDMNGFNKNKLYDLYSSVMQ